MTNRNNSPAHYGPRDRNCDACQFWSDQNAMMRERVIRRAEGKIPAKIARWMEAECLNKNSRFFGTFTRGDRVCMGFCRGEAIDIPPFVPLKRSA